MLKRLFPSDGGSFTLEFALLAPAFILFLYSIFELLYVASLPSLISLVLDNVTRMEARAHNAPANSRQTVSDIQEKVLRQIQKALGGILAPQSLSCRLFSYPSAQHFQRNAQQYLTDFSRPGSLAFFEVQYRYKVASPFTQLFLGRRWDMTVTTAVQYD